MKSLLTATIVSLSFATGPIFASIQPKTLDTQNFVVLNSDSKSIFVDIQYPGLKEERCGFIMQSSLAHVAAEDIKIITDNLVVSVGFDRDNPYLWQPVSLTPKFDNFFARFALPKSRLSTYLTTIRLETIDDSSLNETIARIDGNNGEKGMIILRALSCKEVAQN